MSMTKDILYVDIDDEITSIIAKIEASKAKVVALVLPKNASILSSSVNMKLLKRLEDTQKKNLVIITTDTSLIALAGAARLHVAKTLKSKPVLPALARDEDDDDVISSEDIEKEVSKKPVQKTSEGDDVIQLDNTEAPKKSAMLGPINKKLKVPNFNRFRVKVFLLFGLLIGSVAFGFYALIVAPKATITLKTEVSTIDTSIDITANTAVKDFDAAQPILPAVLVEKTKKDSEKVPATGKKDIGEKATGPMTIVNCTDNPLTIPAGTIFTNSGFSFALDASVTVPASDFFSAGAGGACKENGKANGMVTATAAGGGSNLSSGREYSSNFSSNVTGTGGAMGGGTSKVVTVLSAADIESAKSKLAGKSKSVALAELKDQIGQSQMFALEETLSETPPKYTVSAAVDAEVADVTVGSEVTYTMLSVSLANMQSLVEAAISQKITDSRQKILDNGLEKKSLQLLEKKSAGEQKFGLSVVATVGPDIDTVSIAAESAGKTKVDIQKKLSERAGVKDVTVSYSPFWVISTPKKASKITVVIEQVNAN